MFCWYTTGYGTIQTPVKFASLYKLILIEDTCFPVMGIDPDNFILVCRSLILFNNWFFALETYLSHENFKSQPFGKSLFQLTRKEK